MQVISARQQLVVMEIYTMYQFHPLTLPLMIPVSTSKAMTMNTAYTQNRKTAYGRPTENFWAGTRTSDAERLKRRADTRTTWIRVKLI